MLLRATHCCPAIPSSFAPASTRSIRPAAPTRLNTAKSENTELLPPVIITPHFGSVSTAVIRTLSQSASSSSARIRASAVPICCPISARTTLTVTIPSRSMLYQILGSNVLGGDAGITSASASTGAKPKATLAPATPIRKERRDSQRASSAARCWSLAIGELLPQVGSSLFDGLANADIRHATAKIADHYSVDVLIGWCRKVLQ